MKRRRLAAALLAASALMTSGCSSFSTSLDSLLAPPKLTEQQAEIYQALLNVKGDSVNLSYPKSGDYRSAFTIYDFDDEPTEEALVFYHADSATDNTTTLRLNFLDQQDGRWVSVLDLPAGGDEVESIMLEKLGGRLAIIISYSVLGQQETELNVLEFGDGKVTTLFKDTYTRLDAADFNLDGDKELLLIKKEKGLDYYTAQLAGRQDDTVKALSSVPLKAQAVSFLQMEIQAMGKNETAIFIDYSKSDTAYGTEVLFCYNTALTNSHFSADSLSRRTNSYTPNLLCKDIDGDGKIEIPVTTPFLGYENLSRTEQVNMVIWYGLDGKELEKKYSAYCGMRGDFMIKLPSRWVGMVTVKVSGDELRFIEHVEDGEILLTFKAASPEAKVTEGWELYYENQRTGYQYFIIRGNSGNSLSLTDAELADCLVFFE